MPKNDRHKGRRVAIWFPLDEHERLTKCMDLLKETNKSIIIRTAVVNFIAAYEKRTGKSCNP